MRILHQERGLTTADRQAALPTCRYKILHSIMFIMVLRSNCLDSMASLLSSPLAAPLLDSCFAGARARVGKAAEAGAVVPGVFTPLLARDIALLWSHPEVRALADSADLQLSDSAPYFLEHAERLADFFYLPTDEDILRARSITTGIVVVPFQVQLHASPALLPQTPKLKFELVDVGGQRSERKKWIQCFDNVTAGIYCLCCYHIIGIISFFVSVLFIISLSDFNQVLYEDDSTNRMKESLTLFEEILNCIFFKKTPFIVFFNKVDLFRQKLQSISLSQYLVSYRGPNEYEEAV